jgi:regulator of protease activity HflC (stomatin/prohibitin superfamily)
MSAARPAVAPSPAVAELEQLLDAQRRAMAAGDVDALESTRRRLQSLLGDAGWLRAVAADRSRARAALRGAAINALLAARGEAQASRALASLGAAPALYTASGGLGASGGRARGVTA